MCIERCHTKSVITKPQNVLVLRDIMCSGYVAGGNTKFFGEKKADGGAYTKEDIRDAITNRLSFNDDSSGEYDSMLAFAVPYGDGDKRDQVVSLSARLLPWEVTGNVTQHTYFPGGPAHYTYYQSAYGLNQVHFGEDQRAAENMEFISQVRVFPQSTFCWLCPCAYVSLSLLVSHHLAYLHPLFRVCVQGSVNNSLCFIGPHRTYSAWSNTFFELTPGQGHFGPDAMPGVSALLCPHLLPTRILLPSFFTHTHTHTHGHSVDV